MPTLWRSGVCSSYAWHWKHNHHYYHKVKADCGSILTLGCMIVLCFWLRWRGHYFVTYIDMNSVHWTHRYWQPPPALEMRGLPRFSHFPSNLLPMIIIVWFFPASFFYKHETDLVFCLIFRPRNIQIHLFTCTKYKYACTIVHQEKLER